MLLRPHAAHFLPQAFACQSLFDALLFAGFKVEGVFLNVLDDIFLLNLALKATECAFQRLAFI